MNSTSSKEYHDRESYPIDDIIDYLVRCSQLSFKNAHVDEVGIRTKDKLLRAHGLYEKSPSTFLSQYGKYLTPSHMNYFENLDIPSNEEGILLKACINKLKSYHSDDSRRKRVRNRRYKALLKLQNEGEYFSEKQMMFRNPLLYEQLIGQYLTDEEIAERDEADSENLTLLNMILETVDRNEMREKKSKQQQADEEENNKTKPQKEKKTTYSQWGNFDEPDTKPNNKPEKRKETTINAIERRLLREEFNQEMYSSFIEGRDIDFDYHTIDNDEQYDDLNQQSQDAEDKYFDDEPVEIENLEDHMRLSQAYKKETTNDEEDTLDTFMEHLNKKKSL